MLLRMHPWYVEVDVEMVRRLYVEDRLTAGQIAAIVGCSEMTIRRRLQQIGVSRRRRGPAARRYEPVPHSWTSALAYAVGLIATDGNLSGDGRHIAIPSKDIDLLECLRRCPGLTNAMSRAAAHAEACTTNCNGVTGCRLTGCKASGSHRRRASRWEL